MASFAEIHKNTIVSAHSTVVLIDEKLSKDVNQNHASEIVKMEYRRFIRNKIIFGCLKECSKCLEEELRRKIENILSGVSVRQYLKLGNHNLLGINLNIKQLTYQEGEVLKSALQKAICEKQVKLNKEFKKITMKDLAQVSEVLKPVDSINNLSLAPKDRTLISYKGKLVNEQGIFMKLVDERTNLLSELLNLRLKKIPNMCIQANRGCKALVESNYLKTKLVEYKTKLYIFKEVPKGIEAYEELIKDIKQQQEQCEVVIEDMKQSKQKYENVGGREFDEILKQYIMYMNSIDKLKKMYVLIS